MIQPSSSNVLKKIPVAGHLTDAQYNLFLSVYAKHNSLMSLKERIKYGIANVIEVKWDEEDQCLEVYYDNGNWWNYHADWTWS